MDVLRKMLPRRSGRDQYSFELLKSSSAQDFRCRSSSGSGTGGLPRYYSNYDHVKLQTTPNNLSAKKSEEVIDFMGGPELSDSSALVGFVAEEANGEAGTSYGFASEDPTYEKAISECHSIRESPLFTQGVLLKCTDRKPMFPYLHLCHFQSADHSTRMTEIDEAIKICSANKASLYGGYDEVYSIQKTASSGESALPAHRHAGYIVIGFKLLDDASRQQNLERTWLSWSGAREIYKYSPRSWNLRRICLLRHPTTQTHGPPRPFVYILMCEYGSILHPSNTIQALDMCERLRVRNCGHIALYQVHTAYSAVQHPSLSRARKLSSSSSSSYEPAFGKPKRNPMMRGFSQDVESHSSTEPRRSRLRAREKSFQCPDEHFHSYKY